MADERREVVVATMQLQLDSPSNVAKRTSSSPSKSTGARKTSVRWGWRDQGEYHSRVCSTFLLEVRKSVYMVGVALPPSA